MKLLKFQQLKKILNVFSLALIFVCAAANSGAQTTVDKTVATVTDSVSKPELITYSDLLWQIALQPGAPLNPPSSEDLNRALQILINQRLFALEAKRLPAANQTEDDVKREIERIIRQFPSAAEFENRLRTVGFDSVRDDNFLRMMQQRVAIEKYIEFRFRSFVIVTPEEENRYYRDSYVPEFRRRNPGVIVPPIDDVRGRINQLLVEREVEEDIERFLDDAKRRAEIEILFEV
jgi:hypothetical protein